MAETNDTIDGLLAEFRGYSAGMPPSYHVTMSWADFRKMLDRLEAAYKRERGDCAKLRWVLETLRELLGDLLRLGDAEYHDDFSNFCDIIDAALTAPTRNCDRFASAEEAWDAYDAWVESYRSKGKTEPYNEFGWLYALATEKEGGAK